MLRYVLSAGGAAERNSSKPGVRTYRPCDADGFDLYLGEVGGLARLVLGDLVHRVLAALLALAVGPPLLGNVHHLEDDSNTHDNKKRTGLDARV